MGKICHTTVGTSETKIYLLKQAIHDTVAARLIYERLVQEGLRVTNLDRQPTDQEIKIILAGVIKELERIEALS